jgi:hypothetical protein
MLEKKCKLDLSITKIMSSGEMSLSDDLRSMCMGPFAVKGDAIKYKRQDIQVVRKRFLCALIHNYLQKRPAFSKIKKQQKREDGKYECGCCHNVVKQLENAHVGETLSTMVDKLMNEYPEESTEAIYFRLLALHEEPGRLYVVCCKSCNKKLDGFVLEQEPDRSGTDQLTHTE